MRFEFDATQRWDEIVDANMRLAEHARAYRQERRRAQWLVAVCYAVASVVAVLRGIDVSGVAAAITLAFGLASGMLGFFVYGRFHDWYARRNAAVWCANCIAASSLSDVPSKFVRTVCGAG